ncbi:MAG TPA: M14 family zinc carboxypeptidase [Pyrinomonadaceae bacterium]|nr:M14 family zinc carboxypeptidase [Pyrinomonadaceae bacterium]
MLALLTLVCVVLTSTSGARQESRFDFYTRGPYREAVPRPQSVTRFDVGDFHTNYATMERVVERIAGAAPDRVRVFDIGETNEYRMMHLLAISAPENIGRLDQIKANIARLSDPRTLTPAEAQQLTASTPVIVWLNYTIHGNESASFEAMMQVVYQLAASDEGATQDVLKNTVALVNVCANPDGHERFVTWYNSVGVGNPEPSAAEHEEPWSIYGRNNRYRFNLNRDNIATSQVETRHMQRAYLEWNPQVFVDHHGQTSQFFFPPAGLPINPNLPPEMTARWLTAFGRANAAQFDARGWDFYVRDIFDLFYPGYWDSWPSLQGATGMTYETDGGGWKGLRWKRDDETIVTFRSSIAKHFIASLTTLETAARERAARLGDYYKFKESAVEEGRSEKVKRFVILPGRDPGRAAELIEILLRAGIEVSTAREAFRSQRAHDYSRADSSTTARDFPAGAYVVDLAQPQKRLAKALLEPNTEQDAAFQREQLARYARNQRRGKSASKEEYGFYDITSWSLPFAFGVETFWTEDTGPFAGEPLRLSPRAPGTIESGAAGRTVGTAAGIGGDALQMSAPALRGGVTARASIAYIIPYDRNGAASLAYRLLREDFKLAVTTRQLNAGGRDWPRGTVVVRVSRNPESLHERIASLARESSVEVLAVNSGFSEAGDTGIGSETVISLKRPRIIVVADEPVSQTSYGAMWWLFDRYGVDFTPMTVDAIKRARLDNYNVIIMPDGSAGRYFAALGKGGVDTLRGWIERGGTLVCVKGAAVFAALKDVNLTSARLVGSEDEEGTTKTEGTTAQQPTTTTPIGESTPSTGAQTPAQPAQRAPQRTTQAGTGGAPAKPQVVREEANQTEKMEGAPPDLPPIASPSARPGRVPEAVPGAIMHATLDRTTPLTYGYDETTLPVLIDSGYFFRPSKEGTNALVFSADENQPLRLAGFVWPDTERLLRGTSYVIEEPIGRGHVVLYAEDPTFRAIWRATTRLFFNSFLFQPVF